jgi:hypothetical protein
MSPKRPALAADEELSLRLAELVLEDDSSGSDGFELVSAVAAVTQAAAAAEVPREAAEEVQAVAVSAPLRCLPAEVTLSEAKAFFASVRGARLYAVSRFRSGGLDGQESVGFHVGLGADAYSGLLTLAGSFDELDWRRVYSFEEAAEFWSRNRVRHNCPELPKVWWW